METISQVNYNFFKIITEGLPTAVLLLNEEYDQIYCNPSFLAFSGLNSSQIPGRGWSMCLHPNERESLWQLLSEVRESAMTSLKNSIRIFKNKESEFFRTITITPVKDRASKLAYLLTFFLPDTMESSSNRITQNHRVKEFVISPVNNPKREIIIGKDFDTVESQIIRDARAEEQIAELKAANKLKDKVLAIISHDLRSPIASLKGLSANFFDEELTVEEKISVRKSLLLQLEAVTDLTENLLGWASRSFSKKDLQEITNLNLFEAVEKNIVLTQPHRISKNIEINNNIPAELETWVNKDHIQIVIRNIITNAIKYTSFGGQIDISGSDLKTHVQLRIADTGIGITSEQLKALFTYSHSNTYGTNGEKGTGLGLLLCKEYVESSGGKIFVSSEINVGTTVTIELPRAKKK